MKVLDEVNAALASFHLMPPSPERGGGKRLATALEALLEVYEEECAVREKLTQGLVRAVTEQVTQEHRADAAEAQLGEWESAWMADEQSQHHYDTREEAEEYIGDPREFRRRKAGPWEPVE